MEPLGSKGVALSLWLGAIAFIADRAHKYIQIEMLGWRGGERVPVTGFFDYMLLWNPGISYGLLDGLPVAALIAIMCVATLALAWWWLKASNVLQRAGLAICLGGALSHIIDRWIYGAVPDFFHFYWGNWSFYVFNISDSAITIGVGILLIEMILGLRKTESPSQ